MVTAFLNKGLYQRRKSVKKKLPLQYGTLQYASYNITQNQTLYPKYLFENQNTIHNSVHTQYASKKLH
jgi:hypothetical protein